MTTTTMPSARTPSARASATSARKFILPVVTVIAAGALAMAMGIPWTSANEGAAGIRLQADDNQGATLTISQMEPGRVGLAQRHHPQLGCRGLASLLRGERRSGDVRQR